MKKNVIIWILAVISIVSLTALLTILISMHGGGFMPCDQKMQNHRDINHHGEGHGLLNAVDMSTEQAEQFSVIRSEHHLRVMPVLDEIRKLRQEFFTLLQQNQVDSAKVNTQIRMIADAEIKLQKESAKFLLEFKSILNKVQQDSLFQFMSRHMDPKISGMCDVKNGEPQKDCSNHSTHPCKPN